MTENRNPTLVLVEKTPRALPVTTDQTIHEGDMVWWDKVNGTLKPLTKANQVAVGSTGGFVGCAEGQNHPNLYGEESLPGLECIRQGLVSLKTTPGEFYKVGQEVTVNETGTGDAQTITVVGVTEANRVGFVMVPVPTTAKGAAASTPVGETLTGASGVFAAVWLEPKWPSLYV